MATKAKKTPPNRKKLNEKTVKAAKDPGIIWDTDLAGLGLRVGAKRKDGTIGKVFFFNYRLAGREWRMKIGAYPAWSAEAARERATTLRLLVDVRRNPAAERKAADAESTLSDVWEAYSEVPPDAAKGTVAKISTLRESSQSEYRLMWTKHIKPKFGKRKISNITSADLIPFHRNLAAKYPYRANRVLGLLSVLFGFAKGELSLPVENPTKSVEKARERQRKRYLTKEESQRLLQTLEDYPLLERQRLGKADWFRDEEGKLQKSRMVRRDTPHRIRLQSVNAIRLMMLTGCRKAEALSATWDEFNLQEGVWIKPSAHTKQKEEHRIPLSRPTVMLLEAVKEQCRGSNYLFPQGDGHQDDVKSAWTTIRHQAGIPDVRIHDLRHQFASVLVSAGQSLPVIGALLGHTQTKTTARYAHLFDDPLKAATEAAGEHITGGKS